jgi:hypothetical protein|tara:strand:+ start:178 stop:327 length:150 start_codon:yes stop_codon:yes gene_type:complete
MFLCIVKAVKFDEIQVTAWFNHIDNEIIGAGGKCFISVMIKKNGKYDYY